LNATFDLLPLSIISDNGLFASHAGIPTKERFEVLGRPEPLTEEGKAALLQHLSSLKRSEIENILWSDVEPKLDQAALLQKPNDVRSVGIFFAGGLFEKFADAVNISLMVRGHQDRIPAGGEVHPSVKAQSPNSTNYAPWRYKNIVTMAKEHDRWFGKLDLGISKPVAEDVVFGVLASKR
jgi:hypothetical protein